MGNLDWLALVDDKNLAWFEGELKENLVQVEAELERRQRIPVAKRNTTTPQEGERNE